MDRNLLRSWLIANCIGFALASISLVVGSFFTYMAGVDVTSTRWWITQAAVIGAIAGAAGGGCLGGCQAWALRPVLSSRNWLAVTTICFAIGYALTSAGLIALQIEAYNQQEGDFFAMGVAPFFVHLTGDLRRIALMLLPGLFSALAQYIIWQKFYRQAWQWLWSHIWGCLIAMVLILQFAGIVHYFVPLGEISGAAVVGALAGIFYALLTAIALSWMPGKVDRPATEL